MGLQNEVRIFTKNFVDSASAITSSHGGTTANLYTLDNDLYWQSDDQVGFSHWDTVEMTLTIVFKVGTVETEMLMDSLILTNHNLREFDLHCWIGGAWVKVIGAVDNEDDNTYVRITAKTTSRVKLTMRKTILPNQRKKIGNLIVARNRIALAQNYSIYEMGAREKVSTIMLGDGSEKRAFTKFTAYRTQKYGCRVTFDFLGKTDYNNLQALKEEGDSFLWYPESEFRPQDIFLVNWVNAFSSKYTMQSKSNGWTIDMELREV